jgi:hypothetical protein
MMTIKVFNIEGLEPSQEGYEIQMYTYKEMITNRNYDRSRLDADEFAQNMSEPIGWVVKENRKNGLLFIPVLDYDKFEYVDTTAERAFMYCDLPHSNMLN